MASVPGGMGRSAGAGVPQARKRGRRGNCPEELSDLNRRSIKPYSHLQRQERKAVRDRLRYKGIKPTRRQWMTCVVVTAIEIPSWALERAHPKMSQSERHVWFAGRPRRPAKTLIGLDRDAGGDPEVVTVEWRPCPVCGRILLALEAEDRRKLDETRGGLQMPCGAECGSTEVAPNAKAMRK